MLFNNEQIGLSRRAVRPLPIVEREFEEILLLHRANERERARQKAKETIRKFIPNVPLLVQRVYHPMMKLINKVTV